MKARKELVPEKARQSPPDTRNFRSKSELVFPVWGDRSLVEGPKEGIEKSTKSSPKI